MSVRKVIGTHSGAFHADEALAVSLLMLLPEYKNAVLHRSRDPTVWAACDVLVDVGGVYDPSTHRYDHHQRGFTETFSPRHATKLSSAGLVYKHFGKSILSALCKAHTLASTDRKIEDMHQYLYDNCIEEYDGIDNGIAQYDTGITQHDTGHADAQPRYKIVSMIGRRVALLNVQWNDTTSSADEQFAKAMRLCVSEFVDLFINYNHALYPAKEIVQRSFDARFDVDPSGQIIVLEQQCNWKEHLAAIEAAAGLSNNKTESESALLDDKLPLYMIVQDTHSNSFRVNAISVTPSSFKSRKALPEPWRGLRDAELSQQANIDGCIFVHATGFTSGNKTRDGALAMARAALSF